MRVAALHAMSQTAIQGYNDPAPVIDATSERVAVRHLVRCECRGCGAHSNTTAGAEARCPNCGASRLVPVEGADLIRPA
jgi:DNA-directed RNA polymerase subunit RPC12/RpoP